MQIRKIYASNEEINLIYKNKTVDFDLELYPGEFCYIVDDSNHKNKILVYEKNHEILLADTWKSNTLNGFQPKDSLQRVYFTQLTDPEILLNVALGPAGTGKTTIALALALHNYFYSSKNIYLSKPTVMVQENNAFGPVPGDINEKYAPYIGSFEIILNKTLGENSSSYLETMLAKKHLQFFPIEFTRGCTFENCTFILDEVQNLTWHELKTVLSRIGENSKIIICGDPHQIDSNFTYEESGLYKLIESKSFNTSRFTSKVTLNKQYRGKIPDLIYKIDKEKNEQS